MANNVQSQFHKNLQLERIVPEYMKWFNKRLFTEHIMRYKFASQFTTNSVVADIACGTGYGSYELIKEGAKEVVGVDNANDAIKYAKQKYNDPKLTFVVSDAAHTNLKNEYYDVVVSFETLEHIQNGKDFIQEIYRIMKHNGLLIISTPNKEMSLEDNIYHLHEYTFEELRGVLNPFKEITYYGQRKVNAKLIKCIKKVASIKVLSLLNPLFHMRPWEKVTIEEIKNKKQNNYLYIIAVCKK